MITLEQCASFAGLSSSEMILGVTPAKRHDRLLGSYLSITNASKSALRDMMVSDLRDFLDLGATRQAADRLIVLRRFLLDYPEARRVPLSGGNAIASKAEGLRGWRPGLKSSSSHYADKLPHASASAAA